MPKSWPRIVIFVGAAGSGKSELSVNFAILLASANKDKKIVLVDLDMVNPYYRSSDAKKVLEDRNIRVIAPQYAQTNVEVPAMPSDVFYVFDDPNTLAVFDIGGEDLGARVLASLSRRLSHVCYKVYMVINTARPFTATADGIIRTAEELTLASRLPIDAWIDNTNLLEETKEDDRLRADAILQEVVKRTKIPVAYKTFYKNCGDANLPNGGPKQLIIDRYILYNY